MNTRWLILILLLAVLLGSACSATRNLPEGAYLYNGSKVKIVKPHKDVETKELEGIYRTILKSPKPNKRFLGVRWKLRRYNLFYTKKEKGFIHWLQKKWGEPPVIFDEQIVKQTEAILANKAVNKGFFGVEVSSEIKKKKESVEVKYIVAFDEPFKVSGFVITVSDSLIKTKIRAVQDKSLIQVGEPYDLGLLKAERDRITNFLRGEGVYFFRADFLKFSADTLLQKNKVHLELKLREQINQKQLLPQTIDQILVYPDVRLKEHSALYKDTIDFEGLRIVQYENLMLPSTLRAAIRFKKGSLYSLSAHQNTLERLSFLRNHQFIDVRFEPSGKGNGYLNVVIKLTPRKRDAIEGSIGLSLKSGLYYGPELSLSYLNRNVFRGGERLRVTAFGNYNFPLFSDIVSLQEQGITMELSKPGLIVPFRQKIWSDNLIAKTKGTFSFEQEKVKIPLNGTQVFLETEGFVDLLNELEKDSTFAPAFSLVKYDFNLAYQWRKRIDIQHELSPLSFVLQTPLYEYEELRRLLLQIFALDDSVDDGEVVLNLEKMLILKPSYTFLYDSRLKKLKRQNYFYRGKVALAGNRLLSQNSLIPKELSESIFFQIENDFRYYWRLNSKHTLGFRLASNISVPLGNEIILPFFDLYTLGGPNSVRAFQPRRVGPGSVEPSDQTFFFTGTGDILLESSLEWRPKLTKMLELGLFIDIGNIWLFDGGADADELAVFKFNNFYKQLATGTGIGFRFDFDILIIRTDFSIPLTKPWLPEGERFVGDKINLGSPGWRGDNLTFFLAFGYSF